MEKLTIPQLFDRAMTSTQKGNYKLAFQDLNSIIVQSDNKHTLAITYIHRGITYLNIEAFEPALADFLKALRLKALALKDEKSDLYICYLYSIYCNFKLNNRAAAMEIYADFVVNSSIGLDIKLRQDLFQRFGIYFDIRGDREKAKPFLDQGVAYKREGRYLDAINAYVSSIAVWDASICYYSMAKTLYLRQDAHSAIYHYICSIHLDIWTYINEADPKLLSVDRQRAQNTVSANKLQFLRKVNPYADLLLMMRDPVRHLGHAVVDLNPNIKKSNALLQHIDAYRRTIEGRPNAVADLNMDLEEREYKSVGELFALTNIRWSDLQVRNPYTTNGASLIRAKTQQC